MPRKHLIAAGITKKQQTQAKIWMKLAKEIKAAAKVGGTNVESNPRLKAAIDKALQNNLSRESIEKNINGSQKDPTSLLDMEYEGYGPNGLGIIIKALSDNENRTVSALRGYFSKLNGKIAKQNSVKTNFSYDGEILIEKANLSEEKIMEILLNILDKMNDLVEDPIKDTIENEDCFQIITIPKYFYKIRDELLKNNEIKIIQSEIKYIPNEYVDLSQEDYLKLERFLNQCEEDDDIQWVVTNFGEVK